MPIDMCHLEHMSIGHAIPGGSEILVRLLILLGKPALWGPGSWVLGPGSWVLGPGSWVLGPGSWVLGPGSVLILESGRVQGLHWLCRGLDRPRPDETK